MAETTEYRALTDEEWWAVVAPICGIGDKPQAATPKPENQTDPVTDEMSDDPAISVSDSGLEVPAVDS